MSHPALRQNSSEQGQDRVQVNDPHSNGSSSIPELQHQLEIADTNLQETEFVRGHSSNHTSLNNFISSLQESQREQCLQEDPTLHDNVVSQDILFIKQFAKQCAEYPGRKPILTDIEQSLTENQKPQLPIILVL